MVFSRRFTKGSASSDGLRGVGRDTSASAVVGATDSASRATRGAATPTATVRVAPEALAVQSTERRAAWLAPDSMLTAAPDGCRADTRGENTPCSERNPRAATRAPNSDV